MTCQNLKKKKKEERRRKERKKYDALVRSAMNPACYVKYTFSQF